MYVRLHNLQWNVVGNQFKNIHEYLETKEISINNVLIVVIEDMNYMKKSTETIRKIANEEDAYDIVSMMEDNLRNYNKIL